MQEGPQLYVCMGLLPLEDRQKSDNTEIGQGQNGNQVYWLRTGTRDLLVHRKRREKDGRLKKRGNDNEQYRSVLYTGSANLWNLMRMQGGNGYTCKVAVTRNHPPLHKLVTLGNQKKKKFLKADWEKQFPYPPGYDPPVWAGTGFKHVLTGRHHTTTPTPHRALTTPTWCQTPTVPMVRRDAMTPTTGRCAPTTPTRCKALTTPTSRRAPRQQRRAVPPRHRRGARPSRHRHRAATPRKQRRAVPSQRGARPSRNRSRAVPSRQQRRAVPPQH
ncbi:hypothetical protein EDB85DRAFT_2273637 [Lactarius pseudohatsudake]|nr:hypothetical protein EDB85DRAFT_2273637 [Lactarius pseudohatsudake]